MSAKTGASIRAAVNDMNFNKKLKKLSQHRENRNAKKEDKKDVLQHLPGVRSGAGPGRKM